VKIVQLQSSTDAVVPFHDAALIDKRLSAYQELELFFYRVRAIPAVKTPTHGEPRMRHWAGLLGIVAAVAAGSPTHGARAQVDISAGPVKIVTQQGPGGATVAPMRLVADRLEKRWSRPVAFVTEPGAGGLIAAKTVAEAAPDGHTLFMALASAFVVLPETHKGLPFDVHQFTPIGFVGEVPMGIAVSRDLPVNSLQELIALSKQTPGGLNVAAAFRGSLPDLTTELFRARSGAALTAIHYPSSAQAMTDIMSGRVPVLIEGLGGPLGTGQVKLLAIAAPERLRSHPDVPAIAETLAGFAASGWYVLVAPPHTPSALAMKINSDLRAVLADPEVAERFAELNTTTRDYSPEQLAEFIRSEQRLWTPVVQRLKLSRDR
jgi:tripartite-type tricarboxylate transporter receptor subunit TctC